METVLAMTRILSILTLILSILLCFEASGIGAETGKLPDEEVNALKEIAEQLGKSDWDFNLNPCDGNSNWSTPKRKDLPVYNNTLYCGNCSDGVCHVTHMSLENNRFNGTLPAELGKLVNLENLIFIANNLTGGLPLELNKLTRLTELMLRSCNISGKIADYIADMTALNTLDLSFNKLEGEIPNLGGLQDLKDLYLTGNSLTGPIPDWIKGRDTRYEIDLSYNNFSESSVPLNCRETLVLGRCLSPCSTDLYALHINCGGMRTTIGNTAYEADQNTGSAKFVPSAENWGTSSTGLFWDRNKTLDNFTAKNVSVLRMNDSELYKTARLSPLSLTYYTRCLANGDYTVTLHFADIIFRDNQSYHSLGR